MDYSTLILCLGADTHTPIVEGDAKNEILQVNDVYQYKLFRKKIADKKNVTLLGGGLVGCEFANDLTRSGYDVHIIEPASTPMPTLLPARVGMELKQALEAQGAYWHLNQKATSIGHHQGQYKITLEDNSSFLTDTVFSAIGLKPRIALAQQAGIETHRGILVDQHLRTNIPTIYAMGDCAELHPISMRLQKHPGWILPYIAPILQSAKTLAQILTGHEATLSLPATAVMIKTSCYPIAICRPPFAVDATWHFEEQQGNLRGYLKDSQNNLWGFVLTRESVKERMALAQTLEKWL